MSYRLQVLIPEELDARLRKAAQRSRVSKGELVRRAIESALSRSGGSRSTVDALTRLTSLGAPTGDIDQMLAEIEAGRS
jgi:predicted transcriptional regulator